MKTETYPKQCEAGRLTQEIVSAGMVIYPNEGYRFYGCSVTTLQDNSWLTTVHIADDFTVEELDTLSALVEDHIPIPLPEPVQPTDPDNKPYVRAESRPIDCTTVFTTVGDSMPQGSIPGVIGGGNRMEWDASQSGEWTTDGAPEGMKKKVIEIQFCDSVWIKEGTVYYKNAEKGSYIDMRLLCPPGGYYMYLTQVQQNTGEDDLEIDHYIRKHPVQGDVPMGDELNTETCSQEMPNYIKMELTITIPATDESSFGYVELELYRKRTVII